MMHTVEMSAPHVLICLAVRTFAVTRMPMVDATVEQNHILMSIAKEHADYAKNVSFDSSFL